MKKTKNLCLYDCSLFQQKQKGKVVLHISGILPGNSKRNQANFQRRAQFTLQIQNDE